MINQLVASVGEATIRRSQPFIQMTAILRQTAGSLLGLAPFNPAVFRTLVRQFDATAVRALPVVFAAALTLGSIAVHYLLSVLTGLGAYDRIGEYLNSTVLHEIAPIACAVIIMFRSGTAIIADVALMKISGELDSLHMLGIPIRDYVFLPRVLAFVLAGPSLTLVFSLASLLGGFFILGYFQDITFDNYTDQILYALEVKSLVILLMKPALMCLLMSTMCIQRGMSVVKSFSEVPEKLTQGLMVSIALIVAVEVVFILFSW